jgi:hypothetical protein
VTSLAVFWDKRRCTRNSSKPSWESKTKPSTLSAKS